MEFEYSDKVQALRQQVLQFMDEYIYPNERRFYDEINTGDRWQPTRVVEELKEKARAAMKEHGVPILPGSDGVIACGSTCTASFRAGSMVTLKAIPGLGSLFTGWGGACSGYSRSFF